MKKQTNKHPKIVIIGAGSLFFGRKLVWSMNRLEGLTDGHLALVDTHPGHLSQMEALARKARETSGASHEISATTDFREALPGADFVILSFSRDNARYRGVDVQVSAKHGIRMCSGDTIGPGGVFRALREFDAVAEVVKAVESICPQAWLINYINPSAVFGIALSKICRTPYFALCDSLHIPHLQLQYMKMLGLDAETIGDFRMRIAGVNHFTWLLEATYRGEDMLPRIHEAIRAQGEVENPEANAKSLFNNRIAAKLADIFGVVPVCTAHTKEYLPYFQGYGAHIAEEVVPPLTLFEHEKRMQGTNWMWQDIGDYVSGRKPLAEFLDKGRSDHATDVVQAIWNDSGKHFYINTPNAGPAVPNMEESAFFELECVVDRRGPRPIPAPAMPIGLRALQMRILETHELTVEGYLQKDRGLLIRALAVDPIINSLRTAERVFEDLVEAQKDVLPAWVSAPVAKKQQAASAPAAADTALEQGQTATGW
ncbi:MAG: glycoside hydrolase family 4 [Opitutales bacterium]|nr:glycoside hydrolase family 4 [Opitutales bacterium]